MNCLSEVVIGIVNDLPFNQGDLRFHLMWDITPVSISALWDCVAQLPGCMGRKLSAALVNYESLCAGNG